MNHWLQKFLFLHTRKPEPDGRPLYAYQCRDEDYAALQQETQAYFPGSDQRATRSFTALFCLYAAETWKRHYEGGPWAWALVFTALGRPEPNYTQLVEWVKIGLGWWQRPVLQMASGSRRFLLTLACEGGLPLRLLARDNAHLTQYFRALLENIHADPQADPLTAAARLAERYLPQTWRQPQVWTLSADLVQQVLALQAQVPTAEDPVAALDAQYAHSWRYKLPLLLEDAIAKRLFSGLAKHAQVLTQARQQVLSWQLRYDAASAELQRRLQLPSQLDVTQLPANLPPRLHLWLRVQARNSRIATLSRVSEAHYHCEASPSAAWMLRGTAAVAAPQLELLGEGGYAALLPVRGNSALGPLPWVFVPEGASWRYQGEGGMRLRASEVRVLAPGGGTWQGAVTTLTTEPDLARVWYQVSGEAHWTHPLHGALYLRLGQPDAVSETLELAGPCLDWDLAPEPVYHGLPRVIALNWDGQRCPLSAGVLEWRPDAASEVDWQTDTTHCWGQIWVRYRDVNGVRLRRKIKVAPSALGLTRTQVAPTADLPGLLMLAGLSDAQIIPVTPGVQVQRLSDGAAKITCPPLNTPQVSVELRLHGIQGQCLPLHLPLPRIIAAFVQNGAILPAGTLLALAQLAGVEIWVRQPAGTGRLDLLAQVGSLSLSQPLPAADVQGWRKLRLAHWQERLAGLLAQAGQLDARLSLQLHNCNHNQTLAQVWIAHYDVRLEPDATLQQVRLPLATLERLEPGWEPRLQLYALPLWDMTAPRQALVPTPGGLSWVIPGDWMPGPWWILAYDGAWARFRPLLWVVPGTVPDSGSMLVDALLVEDRALRQTALNQALAALGQDPNHADWPRLLDYLALTQEVPVTALDLCACLPQHPTVLILLLLKVTTGIEFARIWALSEALPFLWHTLPLVAWQQALTRHFSSLRAALVGFAEAESMLLVIWQQFRTLAGCQQPFVKLLCDCLQPQLFPQVRLENSELRFCRGWPHLVEDRVDQAWAELQARHAPDEPCPELAQLLHQARKLPALKTQYAATYLRPIRLAPQVALAAAQQGQCGPGLIWELRLARLFDPEWFDAAFAGQLCLYLAQELRK